VATQNLPCKFRSCQPPPVGCEIYTPPHLSNEVHRYACRTDVSQDGGGALIFGTEEILAHFIPSLSFFLGGVRLFGVLLRPAGVVLLLGTCTYRGQVPLMRGLLAKWSKRGVVWVNEHQAAPGVSCGAWGAPGAGHGQGPLQRGGWGVGKGSGG